MKTKNILGWSAVVCTTAFAVLWGFWGIIENFHEGWYYDSLWKNLSLMFVQYMPWTVGFVALGIFSLRYPRSGATLFLLVALLLPVFIVRTPAAIYFISIPLAGLGLLFWFGRPQPIRWANRTIVFVPLLTVVIFGVEPAWRVSHRIDDGMYGARTVTGNGVTLTWAPEGPGWPHDFKTYNGDWYNANRICSYLSEDGTQIMDSVQNIWRLPTVEEVVRSLTRDGRNTRGIWNPLTGSPAYERTPDKETPLWKVHSPIIYWWTGTESGAASAYRVVYNGSVQQLAKKTRMGDLAFRAVKTSRDARATER